MPEDTQPTIRTTGSRQPHHDEQLIMFLEPDQLVIDKSRPVPRAQLSRRASAGLWALRAFVLVVTAMVLYTFFAQLGS
ncbi:MAG: hypothetical protein JOZ07_05045 [Solirubrobacterales bacterium]|nr:hypothetical protein [Solirubrobacterales bacterium]